jgi:hypothetical protein
MNLAAEHASNSVPFPKSCSGCHISGPGGYTPCVTCVGTSKESHFYPSPWVMPRLHIVRTGESGVLPSDTSTDFGAAVGLSVNSESRAGFHVAIDYVNLAGGSPFGFAMVGTTSSVADRSAAASTPLFRPPHSFAPAV